MKVRSPKSEVRRKPDDQKPGRCLHASGGTDVRRPVVEREQESSNGSERGCLSRSNVGAAKVSQNVEALGEADLLRLGQPRSGRHAFSFRASGFLRTSDFGLRIFLLLLPSIASALVTNKIPDLKPLLPEVPATFLETATSRTWWDTHLWSVLGAALVVFAVLMALVRLLYRPSVARELLPETVARAALEKLRTAPDNEATAAEVGRQLRRFTQAALALPVGELTTDETLRALAARPTPPPPALSSQLGALFRECDARRFAPVPPAGQPGLAARALDLVAQIESFRQPVPPKP